MVQKTDLYSILSAYVNKNNSPYINIDQFLDFLERYAKRAAPEQPEWLSWTENSQVKFWAEISKLVEAEKCELLADTPEGRIYMPFYYAAQVQKAYGNIDDAAFLPFPSEESLGFTLRDSYVHYINLETGLAAYFEAPQEKTDFLLKMLFPDNFGSLLALPETLPKRLIEAAFLKIRHYLRSHGNREYIQRKLAPQLQGKDLYLQEILNKVLIRPFDCFTAMKEGDEFAFMFWAHFCILVRGDIRKKKERLSEDIAAAQAVYLVEAFNGYYKTLALKRREIELAFRQLDLHLDKPPYYYTMEDILKFTSDKGILLLGQYSRENLEERLKKKTTEASGLPELAVVQGPGDERGFVKKNKMLPLCVRLLAAGRASILDELSKRWQRLFREYRHEGAMQRDEDFEKLLGYYINKLCPLLANLLKDPRLRFLHEELEKSQGGVPAASRIFDKGNLIPYSSLLLIRRKGLLADTRILLPFWYSIPGVAAIIAFFRGLGRKNREKKGLPGSPEENETGEAPSAGSARELGRAAGELEAALLLPGKDLDASLADLQNRWIQLIDKQARINLMEDVNSLIRDTLRKTLRVKKHVKITGKRLEEMAEHIIGRTAALRNLSGQDSLHQYIELYLVKLMKTFRF
jgi:hypothetical protein